MDSSVATLAALAANPTVPATPANTADPVAARKAGQDFEALFLSQSFENMFGDVEPDPLFGGGNAEGIYRSMLLQEYSKVAAKSSTTGIADAVTREILRLQGSH
jgi:peptidoglycan hydrolase FlgJ